MTRLALHILVWIARNAVPVANSTEALPWTKAAHGLTPCEHACRFAGRKEEQWWLVVGDSKGNALLAIRRVTMQKRASKHKLEFDVPAQIGTHKLTLYFICDSYLGCDQVSALPSCAAGVPSGPAKAHLGC